MGANRWSTLFNAISCGASLVGLGGLFWIHRTLKRHVSEPLQQLIRCIDAAATGDMSLLLEGPSADEWGRLSQSLTRLIGVMSRSENLVYHLAALVEASGDAIVSQSLDGTILSWNTGAQRLYGYAPEEVRGHSIALLSPEDGATVMRDVLNRIARGERVLPFEQRHRARNGRMFTAFIRVAAIHDSTRRVIGVSYCAQELSVSQPALNAVPSITPALPSAF